MNSNHLAPHHLFSCFICGLIAMATAPAISQPRLSLSASAQSLSELLASVSTASGIKHSASKDVSGLKMTLYVNELPLAEFRDAVAEVMHLSWEYTPKADGRPEEYRLLRTQRNLREEEELENRSERLFRVGIHKLIDLSKLPDKERNERIVSGSAIAETFGQTGALQAIGLLSSLDNDQLERAMDRHPLRINLGTTSKHVRNSALSFLIESGVSRETAISTLDNDVCSLVVVRTGSSTSSQMGISIQQTQEGGTGVIAGVAVRGVHSGEIYADQYHTDRSGRKYSESLREVVLQNELGEASADDLLVAVAKELKINLIAASYRLGIPNRASSSPSGRTISSGKRTIADILDAAAVNSVWWPSERVYLVQSPLWWMTRREFVPDDLIERLKETLKRKQLSLDDWIEFGSVLTGEQWHVLDLLSVNGIAFRSARTLQPLLGFVGRLPNTLRSSLFTPHGLEGIRLSSNDRGRFLRWLASGRNSSGLDPASIPWNAIRIYARHQEGGPSEGPNLFRAVLLANGTEDELRSQAVPGDPPMTQP